MKLISCHIENFGTLSDFNIEFDSGLNVIHKPNGWGKSTLAAFIRVMFWGFNDARSKDELQNERKRFKPWQGGVYGGNICFENQGIEYILTRIFGDKEKDDVFELRNRETNLLCNDYDDKIGEAIWGVDAEAFARTVFISQDDVYTNTTDRINAKISNLTENTDDINNFENADALLKDILNQYSDTRKTGILFRQKEELARLENELSQENKIRTSIEEISKYKETELANREDIESLREELNEKQELRNKVDSIKALIKGLELTDIELKTLEKAVPTDTDIALINEKITELNQLELEKERAKDLSNNKAMAVRKKVLFLIFAGVFAIGAISLAILKWYIPAAICGTASFAMLIAGILYKMPKYVMRDYDEEQEHISDEINELFKKYLGTNISDYSEGISRLYNMRAARQTLETRYAKYLDTVADLKTFGNIDNLPMSDEIVSENRRLNIEFEKITSRISSYDSQLQHLNEELYYLTDMREEFNSLIEEHKKLQDRIALIRASKELLAQAKINFTAKYTSPVLAAFKKYYAYYSDVDDFYMDANINLSVERFGMQRNPKTLSRGYNDIVGVCMRLALYDVMYPQNGPFMVWDDPFVNLDSNNLESAQKLLLDVSKDKQIIFFDCKEKILDTMGKV